MGHASIALGRGAFLWSLKITEGNLVLGSAVRLASAVLVAEARTGSPFSASCTLVVGRPLGQVASPGRQSMATHPTGMPKDRDRIDFAAVKSTFPLLSQVTNHVRMKRENDRYVGKCPFHQDKRPSFVVYPRDNRYKCYSCGRHGDVFDFLMATDPSLKSVVDVVEYLMPGGSRIWATEARQPGPTAATTEEHEGGGILLERRVRVIHPKEVEVHAGFLRDEESPRRQATAEAREYSRARGWLPGPGEIFGVDPYPVGTGNFQEGVLSEYTVVGFRKRVDRQTAYLFGLEEQFEQYQGQLYVGTKMRLTPSAYDAYLADRRQHYDDPELVLNPWISKTGYTNCIPGSVDYNFDASCLVICEGPGDAVRLFHEAHRTREVAELFGQKVHITYADSASSWTEASLPRREGDSGGKPVSFFTGYKSVVLLYDNDEPDKQGRRAGRRLAEVTLKLVRQQVPGTTCRDVQLPCKDVSDFFDLERGTIPDLIDLIKQAAPVR